MKVVPLILRHDRLTETELSDGLNLNEKSLTWRAIVQVIEDFRDERLSVLAQFIGSNSVTGISGAGGAIDILNTLMADLERQRLEAVAKHR